MNKTIVSAYTGAIDFLRKLKFQILVRPFLWRKPKYDKKYAMSICGIFKNEARFLKEWIEYHQLVGIDHFYLYNNDSTDNYRDILQPYINMGLVTLIEFPGDCMQMKAYLDFYNRFANETQWVSFLDIDEFICPNSHLNLKDWIKSYDRFPVILIYWKMFGTSGLMKHDDTKLVVEQYHVCWNSLYHVGKCFINTDYPLANPTQMFHHEPAVWCSILGLKTRVYPINQFKKVTINELSKNRQSIENNIPIQINHYWSKAWDIYDGKRNMTDVIKKENPKKRLSYFLGHEHKNCSTDYNIYKYLMQLKLKMKGVE